MDAAIVGQLLSHTLPVLYRGIQERSKKLSDLDADVRFINVQLDFIKAAIREDRKRRNEMSDVRKSWMVQLRRLAYLIEDCVDRFLPHGGEKINHGDLASEIQQCKKLAQAIREGLECYTTCAESQQKPHQVASSSGSAAPRTSYEQGKHDPQADLVGMDERVQDLLALVWESESPEEKKLKVISIVGFGGIGKTQLANQVYRHSDVRNQYPLQAFISAAGKSTEEILQEVLEELLKQDIKGKTKTSIQIPQQHQNGVIDAAASTSTQSQLLLVQNGAVHAASASTSSQAPKLQNGLVHCASASSMASINKNDVRTRLRSYIQSKRYLIVIDDMRTEQQGSDVVSAFPEQEGVDSRIIVTTSIHSVAKSCSSGDGHVYKMRPLNEEESESLFFNVARTGPQPTEIPKKCDGVPLALVSIARFCRRDLSRCEEAWRKLCKPEEDYRLARMQRVLVDNYESLCNLDLHGCLLYLSMFPCGHPIRRGSLIRRWLAEGPDVGCSTSRTAAEKNFDALIDRNVVWPINECIKTCQPPEMMLEYITGESESTDFMALCCGDNETRTTASSGIRRLALHGSGAPDDGRVLVEEDVSRLRTLAVFRSNQSEAEAPLSFTKCGLLRVLDLEACHGLNKSHLEEICELLKLLRYLSLRASTCITKVPRKIARLQRLETLDLGKETVVKVPAEVLLLPHLKHLLGKIKLRKCDSGKNRNLDRFLSKESKLEMLSGFVAGKDGRGFPRLMRHMSRLRKVKIWWDPDADGTRLQDDLQQAINQFLDRAARMPAVSHSMSMEFQEWSPAFLDSLCAPVVCTLSSMKLRGHGGLNRVPTFVTSLTGIKELCLLATTLRWNAIQDGVRNLNILNDLELVAQDIDGAIVIDSGNLNSLKRMRLEVEHRLIQITIQDGSLESLVTLHLICKDLNGPSADQIGQLRSLKEVALHPEVADGTKLSWKDAARRHPNRPNCLFITYSRLMGQTTQPASPNQTSSAAATGVLSNVARKSRQIAGAILHLGARTRGN
ncbi:unnamed protein product [Urochloa humidicola]